MPWTDNRYKKCTPVWVENDRLDYCDRIRQLKFHRRKLTEITGERWSFDHSVPINSPLVCGLHYHKNIELMLAVPNSVKGNHHWPDMPDYTEDDLKYLLRVALSISLIVSEYDVMNYAKKKCKSNRSDR